MNHQIEFKAMGCHMVAIVDSRSRSTPRILQQVPGWFEEWEQSLSRFRPESELNRLNRSAGWPFQVSSTLWEVFQASVQAEISSDGLVTPAVLQALLAAGYDRSFEALPAETRAAPAGVWPATGSLAEVKCEPATRSLWLPPDIQLDFGGVAKGWAAERAAQRLSELGPALVSAGGDIAITAGPRDGNSWAVGVDDPFHPGAYTEILMLGRCGVATSGIDYRRWKQDGQWNHHIIDPRSGMPALTDVLAATVIAPDAVQAEVAAKVALISGSQSGLAWLQARPELAGMLILQNGRKLYSRRMEGFLWRQS